MPADTPFEPQQLVKPNKEEIDEFTKILSEWMDLKDIVTEVERVERKFKWSVQTAPELKMIREARQVIEFLKFLQGEGRVIKAVKMTSGSETWPDFWMDMNGEELPCELTTIHADSGELWMPIHRDKNDNLILDFNTDYSNWPEDQIIKSTSHAGRWKNAVSSALRKGEEIPLGSWPQGDIINYLHLWVDDIITKKLGKENNGNYIEGTILVISAEFEIKSEIQQDFIQRLSNVMKRGTSFRAVFLHVPNSLGLVWPNPSFPPFEW